MLTKIVNRFRGQLRLRVEAAFPERVLNLCSGRGIPFWDLHWENPAAFSCRACRRDLAALRQAVERLDGTVEVLDREGVPFFLGRFRRRQALLLGLALCAGLMFFGSFFIWDFTVEGNHQVPREEILRSLERNGVEIGTFAFSLDAEDLRNHVLLEIPELVWITVNVSGCRASVQVRERVEPPEPVDRRTPANVVARRGGVVRKVQALSGGSAVLPGTTVEEGQLLISGVEDTGTVGSRLLAGMGSVEGRTWYRLQSRIPCEIQEKHFTGEERSRYALVLGKQRIKFFQNPSGKGQNYDKIVSRQPWTFLGLPLPLTLLRETEQNYTLASRSLSDQEAEQLLGPILEAELLRQVVPYGTVNSTLCSVKRRGETWEVTLQAECTEEIGISVPIYQAEPEGAPPGKS